MTDRGAAARCGRVAEVVVDAPVGLLTYLVPDALADELAAGVPVVVPLGRRRSRGYVVSLGQAEKEPKHALRPIEAIDDGKPILPAQLLELLLFASRYYRALPGDMLAVALPEAARSKQSAFRLTEAGIAEAEALAAAEREPTPGRDRLLVWALGQQARGFTATGARRALGGERPALLRLLRRFLALGLCEASARLAHRPRQERWLARAQGASAPEPKARPGLADRLFALLPEDGDFVSLASLREQDPRAASAASSLVRSGRALLTLREQRTHGEGRDSLELAGEAPTVLSAGQQAAKAALAAAIESASFQAFLLFGITGSGKTEVYLQAIEEVLRAGRTALVLVPEIALTPQLGARFRARFGGQVATFHSGLTPAERRDEWERVASGAASIALGARSALFLPLARLGILIVDEEHESSFKQAEAPPYHARDLAIWRAREAQATVVLGSATPSLESYTNAKAGRFQTLLLPARARGEGLPKVELISLKTHPPAGEGLLSPPLIDALQATFAAGQQAILFLNRRGFAPYIFCRDCGHAFGCTHCEVSLTLHRRAARLLCHYCGHVEAAPDTCPMCRGHRVGAAGPGTERLEAEIRGLFAGLDCCRLDRDAVRTRSDLLRVLRRFRQGEVPLLIGTQMVAKGHDFPGVTLVGAVSADASLNFPDFRAAERTFQLLTQVAGRAGRGEVAGRVLVQAYETDHYAIEAAAHHDFERFARHELAHREALGYPPFAHLALIRCEGEDLSAVELATEALAAQMRTHGRGTEILGPAPAPLARLRGLYRFHVLIKAKTRPELHATLNAQRWPPKAKGSLRWLLDIDPIHML